MQLDREAPLPGYWPSKWPVECGGNRRQKAVAGELGARGGSPMVTTRQNGRWNVMVVEREAGQFFLNGTMPAFTGPPPYGWVERIDIDTLEPEATSPELPCGDHVWCGAVLAHGSGALFNVNGSYLHRLDVDCNITGELRLPADEAHNGLLALSDGSLVTKDLRLEGHGGSTLTRIDADSMVIIGDPLVLPEGSMGRIAADHDPIEGTDHIYVPGIEHLWRVTVKGDHWSLDESWSPRYRRIGAPTGLAWDSNLSAGSAWLMDCGDVAGVRAIFDQQPNGRFGELAPRQLSWQHPAPWSGAQRLLRVDGDSGRIDSVEPFGTAGGGIIAPPVHVPEHGTTVCWDSINGGLAGVDDESMEVRWVRPEIRATMQPAVWPDSGELAINDFVAAGDRPDDNLVVVDIATGELLCRTPTGSRLANGMFLSPGSGNDVLYCSTLAMARVVFA